MTKSVLLALVLSGVSKAETGITNIINGTTVSTGGIYLVGATGPYNGLIITNAGRLNSSNGVVGLMLGAGSNSVVVTGAGSVWSNTGDFTVGLTGAFNRVSVLQGARVWGWYGLVGYDFEAAGNSVLVDGVGSLWTNSFVMRVGILGSRNQLTISGGGRVDVNLAGDVGASPYAVNNTVLVSGASSVWNIGTTLTVGAGGNGNRVIVTNGARVEDSSGNIANASYAFSNAVTVTGTGSLWSNRVASRVGYSGYGNLLTISDGGLVVDADGYVGHDATAYNNRAVVTGTGSRWEHTNDLFVGYFGASNRLSISSGGVVSAVRSGSLGEKTNSNWNVAEVNGAGSLWTNGSTLYVGRTGSWNRLVITNGGTVVNGIGIIGDYIPARGNSVVVVNTGSLWRCGGVAVGRYGAENEVQVLDGGQVMADYMVLGDQFVARSNFVRVSGAGSILTNRFNFIVGDAGSHNRLLISNGGPLINSDGTVGWSGSGYNNSAVITDPGSVWICTNDLNVGYQGSYNRLTITNGGRAVCRHGGYVGYFGAGNTALVTGAGSVWSNAVEMWVGYNDGFANRLSIRAGGSVVGGAGGLGNSMNARSNLVLVSDAGSAWSNSFELTIGLDGSFNSLIVTNGGRVDSLDSTVGSSVQGSNNTVLVSGTGSLWKTERNLWIGFTGLYNRVTIRDGGTMASSWGYLGWDIFGGGFGNSVLVGDPGSLWTNAESILVGTYAPRNELVITNGGTVRDFQGIVGYQAASEGNTALVTGTGSLWRSADNLYIGNEGDTNSLTISAGGQVWNNYGTIGWNGRRNTALVSGTGTLWRSDANLTVGQHGRHNALTIRDGARVLDNFGRVGDGEFALSNLVVISDAGSFWDNKDDVLLGINASYNTMIITNGGRVENDWGWIGYMGTAHDNVAIVTGAGSLWSNRLELYIGWTGRLNRLVIEDGGRVETALDSYVGTRSGSISNSALVTGTGSLWKSTQLIVGWTSSYNSVTIAGGGRVTELNAFVGSQNGTIGNRVQVTDVGSTWSNRAGLWVGYGGSRCDLVVTNGGVVFHHTGGLGYAAGANSNRALVTGTGSLWTNGAYLAVGYSGDANQLIVEQGGQVIGNTGYVGIWSTNNTAQVRDNGSIWSNSAALFVGFGGTSNRLYVSDGGAVCASNLLIGSEATAGQNFVFVDGGRLEARAASGSGALEVRRGELEINSGTVYADRLISTNGANGVVDFNGGAIRSGGSTISDGSIFQVGNGADAALMELLGGIHSFANGINVSAGATLGGNGTITGPVTIQSGGALVPGMSIGHLAGSNSVTLQAGSTTLMEISRTPLTNDTLAVGGPLTLGGALIVTNLAGTLANGDTFVLFIATNITGNFASVALPPLGPALRWNTNHLATGGYLSVTQIPPPSVTAFQLGSTNFILTLDSTAGGIYILQASTNLADPVIWRNVQTNTGTGSGITNSIPVIGDDAQKFFRNLVE